MGLLPSLMPTDLYSCVASVPGLPRFDLPFAFTIIHGIGRSTKIVTGLPLSCIIVERRRKVKMGETWNEANSCVLPPCTVSDTDPS